MINDPIFNVSLGNIQPSAHQAMIFIPVLTAAGVDVDELSLSRTFLLQAHYNSREVLLDEVRQNLQPIVPLAAHFDDKMLACLDGSNHDFLAIVKSGFNVEKFSGISRIPLGSGVLMGKEVVRIVSE